MIKSRVAGNLIVIVIKVIAQDSFEVFMVNTVDIEQNRIEQNRIEQNRIEIFDLITTTITNGNNA